MKILYSMDPKADIAAVRKKCAEGKEGGYEFVCLPQWFVSTAAEELKGSAVKPATILSLPGGTTMPQSKFAEAKQAILNGAGLIIFPVNMALCEAGDFAGAKADLDTALVACKIESGRKSGALTAALIDGEKLDAEGVRGAVGFCAASGVGTIFVAHNEAAVKALGGEFPVEAF